MITALILGITIGFALCIAPGPIAVAFMKKAIVGDFRPALKIGLGAASMDVVFNLLAAFASSAIVVSLSNLFLENRWLSLLFQLISIMILLVLGTRYYRQKHVPTDKELLDKEARQEATATQYSHGSPFFLGVMLAVTNLATPTFFPSMIAAVSYLHAEGFLVRSFLTNLSYAVGFGLGTVLWFTILLRFFKKHRTKLSDGFINTMFKAAGITLLICAGLLAYNILTTTQWSTLFSGS
jgi:threonine/homoserine/homoserine lactone efflux protein